MKTMKVHSITSVDFIDYYGLSVEEQSDFDWEGAETSTFFRFMDSTYCLDDFLRFENPEETGWEGHCGQSAFSAVVIKDLDSDGATVGYAHW